MVYSLIKVYWALWGVRKRPKFPQFEALLDGDQENQKVAAWGFSGLSQSPIPLN